MNRGSALRGILPLALALGVSSALTVAVPLAAAAGSGYFNTNPQHPNPNVGQDSKHALAGGDWISVGIVFADHNHHNPATALYLQNAEAVIDLTCSENGTQAGQLTIALPVGPYSYPGSYEANGGWWPTNKWQDPSTYQTAVQLSSAWCNGGQVFLIANGERYSGTLASSDNTSDQFHIQLHTAIPGANNQSNVSCADTAQNPSPGIGACNFNQNGDQDNVIPAAYTTPTPTATPTPSPAPSTGPSPAAGPTPAGSTSGPGAAVGDTGQLPVNWNGSSPDGRVLENGSVANGGVGGLPGGPGSSNPRASGVSGVTSAGGSSSTTLRRPPAVTSSPPEFGPGIRPLPVVAPLVTAAAASLFAHLPMQWFALLAALDVALALAIIARLRRAEELSHQTESASIRDKGAKGNPDES